MAGNKRKENYLLLFLMVAVFLALVVIGIKILSMPGLLNHFTDKPTGTSTGGPPPTINITTAPIQKDSREELVHIYYPRRGDNFLAREERRLVMQNNNQLNAEALLNELLNFAVSPKCDGQLLGNGRYKSLYRVEDTFYLDMPAPFFQRLGGVRESLLKIYAVVNTLTQLEKKCGVVFLREGQTVIHDGVINFEAPFYFSDQFVAKSL